jgi:hypothetical protein
MTGKRQIRKPVGCKRLDRVRYTRKDGKYFRVSMQDDRQAANSEASRVQKA